MVVDGHGGELPAGAIDGVTPVSSNAVAKSQDPPELFGIQVEQLARRFMLVRNNGFNKIERLQARQAQASQEAADRGSAATHHCGNAAPGHAGAAQLLDPLGEHLVNRVAGSSGLETAIVQGLICAVFETLQPLVRSLAADARGLGRGH